MDELERLVDDYLRQAAEAVTRLQGALGRSDLLRGWATGEIVKNGATPGGVTYSFHGIGCRIHLAGLKFEVDFSPPGRFDGRPSRSASSMHRAPRRRSTAPAFARGARTLADSDVLPEGREWIEQTQRAAEAGTLTMYDVIADTLRGYGVTIETE
jgi:hypothetical protein